MKGVVPTLTWRIAWPQPGQPPAAVSCAARSRRAPHFGQNCAPSKICAKQDEQLTVASVARQYGHRCASGSTAAPQFGQCKDVASVMGWFLRIGNWTVAKLIQFLYGGPSLSDCGCTMRLVHRASLEQIRGDLTVGGSHFLPEMVILGLRRRLKIIEVPVNYRGRVGESKITGSLKGTLTTGFKMIGLILKYRIG